jgi:hypothetical protein
MIRKELKMVDESEAKDDFLDFLSYKKTPLMNLKIDFSRDEIKSRREYRLNFKGEKIIGMSRAVALAAHYDEFDQFVIQRRGHACYF